MAPFHTNPPLFNMLLVSNGHDKNQRKLNGLKHLFWRSSYFWKAYNNQVIARCEPSHVLVLQALLAVVSNFFVFSRLEAMFKFPHISHTNFPWNHFTQLHHHLIHKSTII
jgi:hypothetical protein